VGGVFGAWQPAYAEAGIASFPVDGPAKKPAVGNYLLAGLRASDEWRSKFGDADALGFACGKRNGVTVVDIDAPGETLLADVLDKLGATPIVVRTASGKHHAWYRHSGEGRKIRAKGFSGPVDVLGGGFAVAPPSRSGSSEYRFLQGSLADVGSLPAIRREPEPPTVEPIAPSDRVNTGERNNALFRACMARAKRCADEGELMAFAVDHNGQFLEPLPGDEVLCVVANVWARTANGQNWIGEAGRVVLLNDDADGLLSLGPDAAHLELFLRRNHWGRPFVIANALAEQMPGGKWSRKRLAAARSALLAAQRISELRPASRQHGPAVYQFKGGRF
jgi:hypothetical protein